MPPDTECGSGTVARSPQGVAVLLHKILIEGCNGEMQEFVVKVASTSVEDDVGVDLAVLVSSFVAPKQPQDVVAVPSAMIDALTEEVIDTVDAKTVKATAVRFEEGQDFIAKARRYPFVGIHNKDPWVRGLRDGPILLRGGVDVFMLNDAGAEFAGDGGCGVRAEGIHNKDFIGPADAFKADTDVALFIERGYECGDFLPGRHLFFLAHNQPA